MADIPRLASSGPSSSNRPRVAGEQLQVRPRTTRLDDRVDLVWLAAVLALLRRDQVYLPPPRRERAGILAAHAEEDESR